MRARMTLFISDDQNRKPYGMTFTAASLRPELARIVAEDFLLSGDWEQTKRRILSTNALQARTPSSSVRMEREFRRRLQKLTTRQLEILATAPADSRVAVAWLAVLKNSPFIFEYVAENLRAKMESLDLTLRPSDYENFIHAKVAAHPELAALQPATLAKIRPVVRNMLREVGILGQNPKDATLQRPHLPPDLLAAITADDRTLLAGFLLPDHEIAWLSSTLSHSPAITYYPPPNLPPLGGGA